MENVKKKIMEKFKIEKIEMCDTFWKRFRGLMFSRPRNLVLVPKNETRKGAGIHMFFVFFPIDVYWLDSELNIVDKKMNVKPFTMAMPKKKAKYIVELKTEI